MSKYSDKINIVINFIKYDEIRFNLYFWQNHDAENMLP